MNAQHSVPCPLPINQRRHHHRPHERRHGLFCALPVAHAGAHPHDAVVGVRSLSLDEIKNPHDPLTANPMIAGLIHEHELVTPVCSVALGQERVVSPSFLRGTGHVCFHHRGFIHQRTYERLLVSEPALETTVPLRGRETAQLLLAVAHEFEPGQFCVIEIEQDRGGDSRDRKGITAVYFRH
jgi:hypothetical protein